MNYKTIKEMPLEFRPYERFYAYGPESLSESELLAILLKTGTNGVPAIQLANSVLNYQGRTDGILSIFHLSLEELTSIQGIGKVKAMQIKCIAELSRRIAKTQAKKNLLFSEPETVASYFMADLRHLEIEQFLVAFLDTKCFLIREMVISRGTVNGAIAEPREVFQEALRSSAVFLCLIHNHPSGDPTPSNQDLETTRRFKKAGELIGIPVVDHIIIGDNTFVSLARAGFLS